VTSSSDSTEAHEPRPSPAAARPSAYWPSTHISWLDALSAGGEAAHYRMLVDLALRYRTPIVRRILADSPDLTPHDAEDICSDYFHIVLMGKGEPEKSLLYRFDRSKSRLRTFISVTLSRFLASWQRHRHAAKRDARLTIMAGELLEEIADGTIAPDRRFDQLWAQDILTKALAATEARWDTPERYRRFQALRPCLIFHGESPVLEGLAVDLGITPAALRQSLLTMRKEFKAEILRAINPTIASPLEQDAEFRHLMEALRGA
jgi:hypothetical protein